MNLASYIDHTLLKADATEVQIKQLCSEALQNKFASVCVNGVWVTRCADWLQNSDVQVCSVIGFPLGASPTKIKAAESELALKSGAKEIDMVINISAAKDQQWLQIEKEIKEIKQICSVHVLKVIIETCLLSENEKVEMTKVVSQSGADFIKTSTGFSTGGANLKDIELFCKYKVPNLKIKASGGIKTTEQAFQFIAAGCSRLGTSSGIQICSDQNIKPTKADTDHY